MKNILYIATILLLNLIGCCGCDSDTKNTSTTDEFLRQLPTRRPKEATSSPT